MPKRHLTFEPNLDDGSGRKYQKILCCQNGKPIRYSRRQTKFNDLPTEMLLEIFSYLSAHDLFINVRNVSTRWSKVASDSSLYMKIDAGPFYSTNSLTELLSLAGKVKILEFHNRMDCNIILKQVSRCSKELREVTINECSGSMASRNLPSKPLCDLLVRCPFLTRVSINNCHFQSCKFFKLIATRETILERQKKKFKRIPKSFQYTGGASFKQIRAYLLASKEVISNRNMLSLSMQNAVGMNVLQTEDVADNEEDIDDILESLILLEDQHRLNTL